MSKTNLFQSHSFTTQNIIQPILQPQQVQYRNKHYKNWGQFKVYGWKNGQPQWYISSFISLFWLLIYFIIISSKILWLGILDSIKMLLLGILLILNIIALIIFYHKNPNILSNSLPLLDEENLRNQVNFCSPCKIIKKQTNFHCQKCKVCIEEQYFHSQLMKTCISKQNIKHFTFLIVSTLLFSFYTLLIV